MSSYLIPFWIFAVPLVLAVVSLAVWRRIIASREDDTLHILHASGAIPQQVTIAHKLQVVDKWGQVLTIIAAVYVLVLVVISLYQYWTHASTI